jgi:hypothetical protein
MEWMGLGRVIYVNGRFRERRKGARRKYEIMSKKWRVDLR